MAVTEFGVNHPLAVKLWSKKLMYDSLKETWIQKFTGSGSDSLVQINPELKEVGDKITYGLRVLISGEGQIGDSTLEGNEENLVFYNDSITINQIRHAVRSAGKMTEQRVPYNMREEARQALTDWLADRYDTSFFNQIAGNSNQSDTRYTGMNTCTAPDSTHACWGGDAASDTSATTSASNAFNLALVDKAVTKIKMLQPQMRPLRVGGENKYVCFIHPYAHYQLRQQTSTGLYMDIAKAAISGGQITKNPIYTGALFEYNGVIFHESTRVPWGTATENTGRTALGRTSVAKNTICGAQAAVMSFGRGTSPSLAASWKEEMFDYGNQLGIAAGVTYGLKKTIFNSKDFGTFTVASYSPAP
jgi:N4-gp56 family major capsid protein